jgi:hypothetical protein
MANGRQGLAATYDSPLIGEPQAGGERHGDYSHEQLIRMDEKFRARVERAITAGDESPQGAAGLAKCARVTEIEMDCDQRA